MNLGTIECHTSHVETRPNRTVPVIDSYKWVGPPVARVSERNLSDWGEYGWRQIGDLMEIGPYVVRIIELDYFIGGYVVARCDTYGDILAFLWPWKTRLEIFGMRLIETLAIWGLAERQPGTYPHWSDVRVLRRLASLVGK